jgi:5-methylcytosine-specific restriction protein A
LSKTKAVRRIANKQDLLENINTLDMILSSGDNKEKKELKSMISRGSSLLCYKTDTELKFAPGKFLGYKDNNLLKYKTNNIKDGRESNYIISKILNQKLQFTEILEEQFVNYCENLGLQVEDKKHKFWTLDLEMKTKISPKTTKSKAPTKVKDENTPKKPVTKRVKKEADPTI